MYVKAVKITNRYLGPSADRFIARQVENHLHKPADELSGKDLISLIDWIKVTASLFVEDNELIEAYTKALRRLAQNSNKPKSSKR